jgi:metal-responsive CopG/Arc/MetJ family transcriptional regulator
LTCGITIVILLRVKTAISIPDATFQAAERVARRLALSRSELYARAVAQFVDEHSTEGVKAALDRVYTEETSGVDPALAELQSRSIASSEW